MLWRILPFFCLLTCCEAGSLIRLSSGERVGFVDLGGHVVIPFIYERATEFAEGYAAALANGKWTIIDTSGAGVSTNVCQSVERFSEGLAGAQMTNKWGFIDSLSNWSIPPRFSRIRPFSEGLGCGELPAGWHYIDRSGTLLAGPFQAAYPFRNGLGIIVLSNRWGILGHDFKFKVEPKFEEITIYEPICLRVKQAGKWGLLDSQLHQIVPCAYDWIGDVFEGAAAAAKDNAWGWVFPGSQSSPHLQYEFAGKFSEGRAAFGHNKKYGFVDRTTRIVIPAQYDEVLPFSEGTAWVRRGNKWGAIDSLNRLAFPMAPYVSVTPFREGIARVATAESIRRGEFIIINRLGKTVSPK